MVAENHKYAVETFDLTKNFTDWWGRTKVVAVDNLNLQVRHNEVFGLLGPNGSGKTTTLKILLSLLHPTKGHAMMLGGSSRDPKISSRIGFLPEESYLYKYLSARETLDFYGRLFGLGSKVRKSRTESLLEMVGLTGVANRAVGTFSKGMARRIGLAQALINDPDLLILDEPTSGLDPIGTKQIKDLISQLAKRGKTILLCSHLLADVEDVCDRIAILYGGRIQTQGHVRELLVQSEKKQITAEKLDESQLERIQQILEQAKAEYQIDSPMEKLEAYFIDIVKKAQMEKQATSGAVSTTGVGGFLAEPEKREQILEKLVTADVQREPLSEQHKETEKVETEQIQPEVKKNVLQSLTSDEKTESDSEQTGKIEQDEPEQIETQETPKKNILDELAGRSTENEGDSDTESIDRGDK